MLIAEPYQATDQVVDQTTINLPVYFGGYTWVQSGDVSYNTSTTETSLLTGTTVTVDGKPWANSNKIFQPSSLSVGLRVKVFVAGTITNTGTPSLRTRAGIVDSAAAFTALADTTSTAMTTITGTGDFEIGVDIFVKALGTSGSVVSRVYHRYNTTTVYGVATTTTVDTTKQWTPDVRVTWSASSASNAIVVKYAHVAVDC